MSIKQKFREFKKEIRNTIEDEKLDLLEINKCNVNELIHSGYIRRKIMSFMHYNEFSHSEINEFFFDHCIDIAPADFGFIPQIEYQVSVIDFVSNLKFNSVVLKLSDELITYIAMLKNETINLN